MGIQKIIAAAGAGAVGIAAMKKWNICPACLAKRAVSALRVTDPGSDKYDNNAALTPPMGWASWNLFRHNINERIIEETAAAMRASGLADAGYTYVNIDDCWQSSLRTADGQMQHDLTTFPSGIPALCKKVNALGLKLGIYSSNGTLTCEDLPASLGNERIDAETFAEWGVEYLKYDFCHNVAIPTLAPEIDKIRIEIPGEVPETVYQAEDAELSGSAKVLADDKLESGKYVSGLSSGNGKMTFRSIEVPKDGEYILTIGLHKAWMLEKYAEIVVNETEVYPVRFASTKGVTHEGRVQVRIQLRAGTNSIMIHNPVGSRMDSAAKQYRNMGQELKRASAKVAAERGVPEKPIVFSICEWGFNQPWRWGSSAGNLWRTTLDIMPSWFSIVSIYEFTVHLWKYASPGAWNDPDMLEVGNGSLTDDENRAHFSLWCMLAAPLLLGNDLRSFLLPDGTPDPANKTLKTVTNKAAIAIDQDPRGIQCRRVKTGLVDVLAKPLSEQQLAVCVFNKSNTAATTQVSIRQLVKQGWIDLPEAQSYTVLDIWEDMTFCTEDTITAKTEKHAVRLYRIHANG